MAGLYVNDYRPWPNWVVNSFDDLDRVSNLQVGTYRGHADRDPGHDMSGNLAVDLWLFNNTDANHNKILAWFKANAKRIGATYIITNSRIWSVERASEGVRRYTGPDPHQDHIHISYGTTPPKDEDEDMAVSDADATKIAARTLDMDGKIRNKDSAGKVVFDPEAGDEISLKNAIYQIGLDLRTLKSKLQ